MMQYDLAIAYRVYPGISKSPAFYSTDKLALAELGLRSLRLALGDLRTRLYAILDGCPPEYEALVLRYFPAEHTEIVHRQRAGNAATFIEQLDYLLEQPHAKFVYFAEDDYLYRQGRCRGCLRLPSNIVMRTSWRRMTTPTTTRCPSTAAACRCGTQQATIGAQPEQHA